MANKSDATLSNNVANFNELIISVNGFGTAYNPTKESLKIPALLALQAETNQVMETFYAAMAANKNAIAARDARQKLLSPLVTRVKNAVAATDTTQQVDDQVKSIVRKILGQRVSVKKTGEELKALQDAGKEVKQVSSSQMGLDARIDNFSKLITLLESISLYNPNEEELKVPALINFINELKSLNTAAIKSANELNNARINRDRILFGENTGICDIATSVKTYVKSVFGSTSPQQKQLGGLRFTRKK